jgi:hypothetical protein
VSETPPPTPAGLPPGAERDGDEQDPDVLFQLRMGLANLALGYWRHFVGLLGLVLVGTLVYGLVTSQMQSSQRDGHAAVATAMEPAREAFELPDPAARKTALSEVARSVEAAAGASSGAAAAYGWMRAAQLWEEAEDAEAARKAWSAAAAVGAGGALGWSAAMGDARASARGGDVDGAATRLRALAAATPGLQGDEALALLVDVFIDAGRPADAEAALGELRARNAESPRLMELAARMPAPGSAG